MKKVITLLGVMFFVVFVAACEPPPLSLLSVQADQRLITLEVDERLQLLPVLEGVDTNEFLYDSDSILIASVSSTGVLIGLRPGIALIKVTSGDIVDYARVIVIAATNGVVTGPCVTKEVIQDADAQFVIVCEDGTTIATGITAPVASESARIVTTEVNAAGELLLTYSDGEVVNVGNVVGAQGQRGLTGSSVGAIGGTQGPVGAKGDTGATGTTGADGADGVVGETVATARDALDLSALLAVAMIDRIVFTSGIVYDSGVTLLYQETITMGDLYFNSGAYDTPTFTMSGLGSHIGDIYVDASSGTVVLGINIIIVGDVFVQNVDTNSFDTSAIHEGRIVMLGRGRLNLGPNAIVEAVEIDSDQPVLLTGVFDVPITIVSANAQITLGEGVVIKELVISETASNVAIQVESGVVVTGSGILLQGNAAEPVLTYDTGVPPLDALIPVAIIVRVTNQTTGINYNTIQAAIDAATSGDTIVVSSGLYEENLTLTQSGLTLLGPNKEIQGSGSIRVDEAIIKGSVTINGNHIALIGFTFQQDLESHSMIIGNNDLNGETIPGDAEYLSGVGISLTNNRFLLNATNTGNGTIALRNTKDLIFSHNLVLSGPLADGVNMMLFTGHNMGYTIDSNHFEAQNLTPTSSQGSAAIIETGTVFSTRNFEITNNVFNLMARNPIQLLASGLISSGLIHNNVFSNYGFAAPAEQVYAGVSFGFNPVDELINVTISDNQFTGSRGRGILIRKVAKIDNLLISGNEFLSIGVSSVVYPSPINYLGTTNEAAIVFNNSDTLITNWDINIQHNTFNYIDAAVNTFALKVDGTSFVNINANNTNVINNYRITFTGVPAPWGPFQYFLNFEGPKNVGIRYVYPIPEGQSGVIIE